MLVCSLKFCFVYFQLMSVPINIRIIIVLLMAKFESSIVVKGKMQVEFGITTPNIDYTIDAFQCFCEMSIVVNRPQFERPSEITKEKIDEVYNNFANRIKYL